MKKVVVRKTGEEGEYIGVFQYSEVIGASPMIGGHRGGVVSYPVVVAKISKSFKQFRLDAVDIMDEIKEEATLTLHVDGEPITFGGCDLGDIDEHLGVKIATLRND